MAIMFIRGNKMNSIGTILPSEERKNGRISYRYHVWYEKMYIHIIDYYIILYLYIICLDHLYKYIYITVFSTNGKKKQLRRLKIDASPESVKNFSDAGALHRLWFLSIGQSFFHWINRRSSGPNRWSYVNVPYCWPYELWGYSLKFRPEK